MTLDLTRRDFGAKSALIRNSEDVHIDESDSRVVHVSQKSESEPQVADNCRWNVDHNARESAKMSIVREVVREELQYLNYQFLDDIRRNNAVKLEKYARAIIVSVFCQERRILLYSNLNVLCGDMMIFPERWVVTLTHCWVPGWTTALLLTRILFDADFLLLTSPL
eukprot:IDg22407t1